jgi:hypothetical protein
MIKIPLYVFDFEQCNDIFNPQEYVEPELYPILEAWRNVLKYEIYNYIELDRQGRQILATYSTN